MKKRYGLLVIAILILLMPLYQGVKAVIPDHDQSPPSSDRVDLDSIRADPQLAKYADPNTVIMFSTSWCPYCREARDYFSENNVEFVEFDVEKDRHARKVYDLLNSDGVPVLLVKGNLQDGFDINRFHGAYDAPQQ